MACELTGADYPDIRIALGLAPDDTEGLPDRVIEAQMYLPYVTARVRDALAGATGRCPFSCDEGDRDHDADKARQVRIALVLLTAATLAREKRVAQGEQRIKRQSIGPLRVDYDDTDWSALGDRLWARGLEALGAACTGAAAHLAGGKLGGGTGVVELMCADGPSRQAARRGAGAAGESYMPGLAD